jgi:NAD(P)-dependent dehydrogenase (short-subunit alcohol dehydrogenase family)
MRRPAQPEEIAPAFVYFASEADSSYVTGEILTLPGGETTAGWLEGGGKEWARIVVGVARAS